MNRSIFLLTALLSVACGEPEPVPPQPPAAAGWPLSRGGPQLQGRIRLPAPPAPAVEWTFDCGQPLRAEPAIAEEAVVIGDVTGTVHCIDLRRRQSRWTFRTGGSIEAAPAVSRGKVFVGSGDHRFLALDLRDGKLLWSIEGKDKFSSSPIVVAAPDGGGEWVLVNGYDGTCRCLRAEDGTLVWTYEAGDHLNGAPATVDGGRLAFGGCDKQVHVLQLADGKPLNRLPTAAQIANSAATCGNTVYCGNYAGQIVATAADAKQPLWIHQASELPFVGAPAVDERHVYLGSRDKSLHAVDRLTGKPAWTFKTGGRIEGSPLAFDDAVVFGSRDGRLYALQPEDGKERWRLDLGEDLAAAPAFAAGRIVIGGTGGTLFLIHDPEKP